MPINSFTDPVAGTSSFPALVVTATIPFNGPGLAGENLTSIAKVAPGSTLAGLSGPERLSGYEIEEIASGAFPSFFILKDLAEDLPMGVSGKSSAPSIFPIGAVAGCFGAVVSDFLASHEVVSVSRATNSGRQTEWRIRLD